jgi:hypothetical protein
VPVSDPLVDGPVRPHWLVLVAVVARVTVDGRRRSAPLLSRAICVLRLLLSWRASPLKGADRSISGGGRPGPAGLVAVVVHVHRVRVTYDARPPARPICSSR